ncbi:SRPBCC domain-containing protein [Kiloniella sp. EL199]|uniref:SRPBCC family protein n=1 Tax=Kiloniella sp. EL199 TaxID=2107581 RepID=UPI000EA363DF|nr:SRPBCC domain-containing protein [Kiloniella sp. EL199]
MTEHRNRENFSDQISSSDLTLEITRRFAAPRKTVFKALTQPEVFKTWWGPKGCECSLCEMDFRVGGQWKTILENTGGDCSSNQVGGIYTEVEDPSKLVFTWAWIGHDGIRGHETEVTILLHDEGEKTLMEFSQKIFADTEQCDLHRKGWESSYDCLDEVLAGK